MGTKIDPGTFDCFAAALPDEPLFVLLARDPLAPFLVSIWSAARVGDWEKAGVVFGTMIDRAGTEFTAAPDVDKGLEAMDCSAAMFAWRRENFGRWRAPRDWAEWHGDEDGRQPVSDGVHVDARMRDGREYFDQPAASFRWQHGGSWDAKSDIVAWRLAGAAERSGAEPAERRSEVAHG